MDVVLGDPSRGSVVPSTVVFTPAHWQKSQQVTLRLAEDALATAGSATFSVEFHLTSQSYRFHGQTPRTWVPPPPPPSLLTELRKHNKPVRRKEAADATPQSKSLTSSQHACCIFATPGGQVAVHC